MLLVMLKTWIRPYAPTIRRLLRGDLRVPDIGYARLISYSQFGEDIWLSKHFGDRASGFYVDVGAYDPFSHSNTLKFYRRGWRGINIEPDPSHFRGFPRFRPRDTNLNLAISSVNGSAAFHSAGAFSGLAGDLHLWGGGQTLSVETRRLDAVLAQHAAGLAIDFLDIDIEGHEIVALSSNDWDRFRPAVVLVEIHSGADEAPARFLRGVGYTQAAALELTRVFVDTHGEPG
jgi:FkbM family methyltransferase